MAAERVEVLAGCLEMEGLEFRGSGLDPGFGGVGVGGLCRGVGFRDGGRP